MKPPRPLHPLLLSLALHGVVFALFTWTARMPDASRHDVNTTGPPLHITISAASQAPAGPMEAAHTTSERRTVQTANRESTPATTAPPALPRPLDESGPESATRSDRRRTSDMTAETAAKVPALPSALSVRDTVHSVIGERTRARATRLQDCSPRQRRNALFTCEQEDTVDYGLLTQDSTYRYFMPPVESDRSRPALDRLVSDAARIRGELEATGHETLRVDGFLQQLREAAGARTRTSTSQRMEDFMLLNDSTTQLRKRVMGQSPIGFQE